MGVVATSAAMAGVAGFLVGSQIKSPADLAAEALAPDPSLIFVPVEKRTLSSRIIVRGTVTSSDETAVTVSSGGSDSPIITRLDHEVGESLAEGGVVVEVATRPLFALVGDLPVFRNLTLGIEGPDVAQLEQGLVRLGYDPGPTDGVYDQATANAVGSFYRDRGYEPVGPTRDEQSAVDAAAEQVRALERELAQAHDSAEPEPVPESTRIELDLAVGEAAELLRQAEATRAEILAPLEQQLDDAELLLAASQSALDEARERLDEATSGKHPDTELPPNEQQLEELREAAADAAADVEALSGAVERAEAQLSLASIEQDPIVEAAQSQLRLAEAIRSESISPYPDASVAQRIAETEDQLANAREDLAELESEIGVSFPLSELLFVPLLPAQIRSLNIGLGDTPQGPIMVLTGESTILQASVSRADFRLLRVGMVVDLDDPQLGFSARGEITALADQPGGPLVEADRHLLQITPSEALPETLFGQSLRIAIPITATTGEVLAVPVAAVSAEVDGTARIEVRESSDGARTVEVVTGLVADGYVEIRPLDAREGLTTDDFVVVGRDFQPMAESDNGS